MAKQNFVLYHYFRDNLLCIIIARTDIRISFRGTALRMVPWICSPIWLYFKTLITFSIGKGHGWQLTVYSSNTVSYIITCRHLWPPDVKNWLIWKDPDARKDWMWEEKGTTEDEMFGWHHWRSGYEFKKALGVDDGPGRLVCCSPWGHKELDTTERLNW